MGLLISCDDLQFYFSYDDWFNYRYLITFEVYTYLQINYKNYIDKHMHPSLNEELFLENRNIPQNSIYNKCKCLLDTISQKINSITDEKERFYFLKDIYNINPDLLIYFGVGGIIPFINKSYINGLFTIGNSYDILELFESLEEFADIKIKTFMNDIKQIFSHSYQSKQKIVIS